MKNTKKNVLLFMSDFYGYNRDVIEEMKRQECNVTWYQDKVTLNFVERLKHKFKNERNFIKFNKYFDSIIEHEKNNHFDIIIIIFGAVFFTGEHIDKLRHIFPDTKIVYYTWDSVANFNSIKELFDKSDKAYSFDKLDCKQYGIEFLPLFYVRTDFDPNKETKWDVSTVMSFYLKKSTGILKVISILPENTNKFLYLRLRDKWYSIYLRLCSQSIYSKIKKHLQYDMISRDECLDIFKRSKVIIDCPVPNQNGLTMRTFETLALNRKLITTNKNIKEYDFYCEENIFVVSEESDIIPQKFFETPFNVQYQLTDKYGVEHFVKTLINDKF